MGLLTADLDRYRRALPKSASFAQKPGAVEVLRNALEKFSGADSVLEKAASAEDSARLWELHKAAEAAYREAVKAGKKPEADATLDKFSGWKWLKGAPGEPGDLHPMPAPDEE